MKHFVPTIVKNLIGRCVGLVIYLFTGSPSIRRHFSHSWLLAVGIGGRKEG